MFLRSAGMVRLVHGKEVGGKDVAYVVSERGVLLISAEKNSCAGTNSGDGEFWYAEKLAYVRCKDVSGCKR